MKFSLRLLFLFAILTLTASFPASAQVDSIVGQFTSVSGNANVFVRGISGDGRLVVVESRGDISTERNAARNNADGNLEIFLFDYAQRRIFQITDTKNALNSVSGSTTANDNIRIRIDNTQPVISNDGRWIAFASNAGVNVPGNTNPGSFDGNACTITDLTRLAECNAIINSAVNPNRTTLVGLGNDANIEIWLYEIPTVAPVDLTLGADLPLTNLTGGNFIRVTTSPAQIAPRPGTSTSSPFISYDNYSPSINDDGNVVAFVSDREYEGSTTDPETVNPEIFVYVRALASNNIRRVTTTNRGTLTEQISNNNPSISGSGRRVAFTSTAANPVTDAQGGSNPETNGEVFYANLAADGTLEGTPATRQVQVTRTVPANPSQVVNVFNIGKRISRDGRFIAFESISDNPGTGGTNQTTNGLPNYAIFVYDAAPPNTQPAIRQIGRRTYEDSGAAGGDLSSRFPVFTDYNANGVAESILFVSRLNYRADGSISTTAGEGLNPDAARNSQIYVTPLYRVGTGSEPPIVATTNLTRLSRFQSLSDLQPLPANTRRRIAFNYFSELGGGNSDFTYEGFYLISSNITPPDNLPQLTFATGASALPVGSPLPTPSPTATPTPSPTPTPTGSPTPTPTPTPVTPTAVPALAPDMIAIAEFRGATSFEIINAGGASRSTRSFELPIELGGVTVSFRSTAGNATNGGIAAAGIYTIDRQRRRVIFVIPKGLANGNYAVTINDNGNISRGLLDITGAQPDIITKNPLPSAGGRALAFNATNRVLQVEPFPVTTFRLKPFGRVPTVIRLFATGIRGAAASQISVRVGSRTISGAQILTGAVPTDIPGVYSVDFTLPPEAIRAGDVPIVLTVLNNSRLDDTAPRVRIL